VINQVTKWLRCIELDL